MDLLFPLISNLLLAGLLGALCIWFTNYNLSWWLRTNRSKYVIENFYQKLVFLEIRLPKEIHKNPSAMEIIFNALYQKLGWYTDQEFIAEKRKEESDGHGGKAKKEPFYKFRDRWRKEFYNKYVKGSLRLWSSLEIVSEEGQIKFFVVTQAKNAEIFKSYTYSQYPGIEIVETKDYTEKFQYKTGGDLSIYVGRYSLDAAKTFLPIKTYVDYGLDKDPKEEYKIDPLTPLLEAMAAANAGEHFWFQILIRPTVYDKEWKKETQGRVDQLLGIKRASKDDHANHIKAGQIISQDRQMVALNPQEKNEVEIILRNMEKNAFDCIVRMIYIAENNKTKFNLNKGVFTVVNALKSFNKPGFAEFGFETITIDSDFPFLDPKGLRTEGSRRAMWKFFKLRTGFYHEAEGLEGDLKAFTDIWYRWRVGKSWEWAMMQWSEVKEFYGMPGKFKHRGEALDFILNTEELATIWHFPGKSFGNSTGRVESIKSDPPRNLPI